MKHKPCLMCVFFFKSFRRFLCLVVLFIQPLRSSVVALSSCPSLCLTVLLRLYFSLSSPCLPVHLSTLVCLSRVCTFLTIFHIMLKISFSRPSKHFKTKERKCHFLKKFLKIRISTCLNTHLTCF